MTKPYKTIDQTSHPVGTRLLVQRKQRLGRQTIWSPHFEITIKEYAPSGRYVRSQGPAWDDALALRVIEVLRPVASMFVWPNPDYDYRPVTCTTSFQGGQS